MKSEKSNVLQVDFFNQTHNPKFGLKYYGILVQFTDGTLSVCALGGKGRFLKLFVLQGYSQSNAT